MPLCENVVYLNYYSCTALYKTLKKHSSKIEGAIPNKYHIDNHH